MTGKDELYERMCLKAGFSKPPMQDELQDMIGDYDKCLGRLLEYGIMGIDRELEYYYQFTSMNQLWLAFVMADKEDKWWCWVERDWVSHKVGVGEDLF